MVSFSGQLRPVWQNLTKIMLKNLSIKVCQLYAAGRSDIDLGNKKNILKKNWACMYVCVCVCVCVYVCVLAVYV